jgi:hypothetical protein
MKYDKHGEKSYFCLFIIKVITFTCEMYKYLTCVTCKYGIIIIITIIIIIIII